MKRWIHCVAFSMVCLILLPVEALAAELLIPGGQIIALELQDDTVTVAAFDDACGVARAAGMQVGDEIVTINDEQIDCAEDVREALQDCGTQASVTIRRSGKTHTLKIEPEITENGPRIGVYLRQGIAGVGTVTYYDPKTGEFGTLGHGVSNAEGKILDMEQGRAYDARVLSVKKGKRGDPGQLRGGADGGQVIGELYRNTSRGVFGKSEQGWRGEPLPVAQAEEVRTGPAVVRSTVQDGGVREYSVEIVKIYPRDRGDNRNLLIRVTDQELLKQTGGIVQGMSGSPIIQDGKLVGAVTHVLVNDPTMGYGILIENMLEAAA